MKRNISILDNPEEVEKIDKLLVNITNLINRETYFSSMFALSVCLYAVIKNSNPEFLNQKKMWEIMKAAEINYDKIFEDGTIKKDLYH